MNHHLKTCPCGSGLERFDLTDAAGIFCCYVCDQCEAEKKAKYNPAIFDGQRRYASTGEEADLWADDRMFPEDEAESPGYYWDEDGRHAY